MITLVPFEPEHLAQLQSIRNDLELFNELSTSEYGLTLRKAGNAFTAYCSDGMLGCAGIGLCNGRPEAWMIGTDLINNHPLAFHRTVTKMLRGIMTEHGWKQVWCSVREDDERAVRWLASLGFAPTGEKVTVCNAEYVRLMGEF